MLNAVAAVTDSRSHSQHVDPSPILAAPLAVEAQQAGKVYRIGYLATSRAANPNQNEALLQGLRDLGYIEG